MGARFAKPKHIELDGEMHFIYTKLNYHFNDNALYFSLSLSLSLSSSISQKCSKKAVNKLSNVCVEMQIKQMCIWCP